MGAEALKTSDPGQFGELNLVLKVEEQKAAPAAKRSVGLRVERCQRRVVDVRGEQLAGDLR
jgi:hypothetical protein